MLNYASSNKKRTNVNTIGVVFVENSRLPAFVVYTVATNVAAFFFRFVSVFISTAWLTLFLIAARNKHHCVVCVNLHSTVWPWMASARVPHKSDFCSKKCRNSKESYKRSPQVGRRYFWHLFVFMWDVSRSLALPVAASYLLLENRMGKISNNMSCIWNGLYRLFHAQTSTGKREWLWSPQKSRGFSFQTGQ